MRDLLSFLAVTIDQKHRKMILISTIGMAVTGLLTLLYPWLVVEVLGTLQANESVASLSLTTLIGCGILLISSQAVISITASNQLSKASESITRNLRQRLFNGCLHAPWVEWKKAPLGDSLSRLISDSSILGHFFSMTQRWRVLPTLYSKSETVNYTVEH